MMGSVTPDGATRRCRSVLAFAVALTSTALAGGNQPYIEGDRLTFAFLDLDGQTVRSSDPEFQGRVLLIDLWATWCPPCVGEIPTFVPRFPSACRHFSPGNRLQSRSVEIHSLPDSTASAAR